MRIYRRTTLAAFVLIGLGRRYAAVPLSTHTLHLKLIDPDGELSKPYSRNITAKAGKATGLIPLALNDKKGIWEIELKDVTSGRKTRTRFEVK